MEWEQSRAVSSTRLRATIVPTQMAKMPFAEYENMGQDIPAASNRSPFQHPKCSPTPHAAWRQTLSRLSIGFGRGEPMVRDIDATCPEPTIAVLVACRKDTRAAREASSAVSTAQMDLH